MSQVLEGRIAKCSSCSTEVPSSESLAFFEFRGEGSYFANELCFVCGYHSVVHNPVNPSTGRPGITDHKFESRGDLGRDSFYCGCYGWD